MKQKIDKFQFVPTPLPYDAAAQFCTNDCGAIASIHFALENGFVDRKLNFSIESKNIKQTKKTRKLQTII